jgi:CheY-like chemotaxis protein
MKILIVDDNRGFLDVMGDLLRAYGYEVVLAEDGKQARETLEAEQVDLIVSDVFMPTLDGNRFHSYVREFLGATEIPFIFYSGYSSEETQQIVNDSKIDFFLSKSSPVEEIVGLIEKIRVSKESKDQVKVAPPSGH